MSDSTNLRQADAKVEVVGIVSENKLEEVTVDGKTSIRGELVIQTDDINFVTFNVFVNAKKDDGTENKTYGGMKTVMNEYKSIAKVGREEATKVTVNGQIRPNSYVGRDGNVHVSVRHQSSFFNRYQGSLEEFDPHAWFEVEMCINAIVPETYTSGDNVGEETGRVIVKGWMPTYNGIEPITLIAPEEDGIADAVLDEYNPGETVRFLGDIVNSRAVIREEIPMKIGKPKVTVRTIYKNEMIITKASDAYGEDSDTPTPEPYDVDAIKKAITDRELRLEAEKDKAKKPETTAAKTKTGRGLPAF